MAIEPASTTVFIKLSDIYLDFGDDKVGGPGPSFHNARSRANVESAPDSLEGGGIEELSNSLRTKGQDFPVILRPNTEQKGRVRVKGQDGHMQWWAPPYELVDGFRRFVAISALYANEKLQAHSEETGLPIVPNIPNAMISAEIRPLDDVQATLLNGRAGISRNNLEPPDLMAHIVKLTRPTFSMSVGEISEYQGLGLQTTHKYAAAGNALLPSILDHWRFGGAFEDVASSKRLSFQEMEAVSKRRKEDQAQAYKEALGQKTEKTSKKDWLNTAELSAKRMGTLLATLEREGVITLTAKPWEESIDVLVKLPAKTRRYSGIKRHMADTLEAAYDEERKRDITRRGEGPE